jgi:hypothetical protein
MTTPRPRAVVIGSLSLFAVLFVVLTFELSASASTSKVAPKAKTAKARLAPAETQYTEPEPEYEEPVYEEPEYVEPEVEEVPPVVTSSS